MAKVDKKSESAKTEKSEVKKNKSVEDAEHKSFTLTRDVGGKVKGGFSGFMDFVREQGVVGLAVGLTIGTAVTVFVKSIVDNIINPIIGALLPGGSALHTKFYCLTYKDGVCVNRLGWGAVLSNLINFLAIAFVVYFTVKLLKLDRLDKKKKE